MKEQIAGIKAVQEPKHDEISIPTWPLLNLFSTKSQIIPIVNELIIKALSDAVQESYGGRRGRESLFLQSTTLFSLLKIRFLSTGLTH